MKQNIPFRRLLLAAAALAAAACARDDAALPAPSVPSEGGVALRTEVERSTPEFVKTRAADKTEEESRINTLHIFIFGSDGNYLEPAAERREQAYQWLNVNTVGSSIIMIDNEGFANPELAREAHVYAVANVEDGTFGELDAEGRPSLIPDEEALRNFYYTPSDYGDRIMSLPDAGMPMFGMAVSQDAGGIGLSDESGSVIDLTRPQGNITIRLRALMARVDVTIRISSEHTDAVSGMLPSLRLTGYSLNNMTTCVPLIEPAGSAPVSQLRPEEAGGIVNPEAGITDAQGRYLTTVERDAQGDEIRAIYNRSGSFEMSFYLFENLQQPDLSRFNPSMYPTDIDQNPDDKQRYKPLMAADEASSFRFEGLYTTYNGSRLADVSYTLYLGENHTDNYELGRNKLYVNDITIQGITTHDGIESGASFDARVNVSTTSNNFFISMLRERNFDAHYCVAPMDIYLYGADGGDDNYRGPAYDNYTMEVEIIDDATGAAPTWIGIERIAAADMANGGVSLDASRYLRHPNESFVAGTGKRRFFTRTLVSSGSLPTSYTDGNALKHRDRLYFYVDENIATEDRTATVHLTYFEGGTEMGSRTVAIEQHGLMPVQVIDYDNGSVMETIYVEAYEEYLDHYDPLEPLHPETVYDGLPWGAMGSNVSSYDLSNDGGIGDIGADWEVINYYQGKNGTLNVLYSASGGSIVDIETGLFGTFRDWVRGSRALELDEVPATAAEYCYRKNKTEDDGTVDPDAAHWFMPAIRELEWAVRTYYATYPEFQNFFYWSCNPAARSASGLAREDYNHARSTKAYIASDGSIEFRQSSADAGFTSHNGEGGWAERDESLRIRAVYIP